MTKIGVISLWFRFVPVKVQKISLFSICIDENNNIQNELEPLQIISNSNYYPP